MIESYPHVTETHTIVVHPTKGFRAISHRRYLAQQAMATVLDQPVRYTRKKPAKSGNLWMKRTKPAGKWPDQPSRQQRRYAKRKGLHIT